MMNRKDHIEKLVDETMSSLDGIQRAEPAPFFHTRLIARMEAGEGTLLNRFMLVISRPSFAIATALVFLLLNVFILSSIFRSRQASAGEEPGQAMAYEYSHSTPNNNFYANNPEHP